MAIWQSDIIQSAAPYLIPLFAHRLTRQAASPSVTRYQILCGFSGSLLQCVDLDLPLAPENVCYLTPPPCRDTQITTFRAGIRCGGRNMAHHQRHCVASQDSILNSGLESVNALATSRVGTLPY